MHTSELKKAEALSNIKRKTDVLEKWTKHIPWRADRAGTPLRDERGNPVLDFFPRTLAAFADWDGSQNCSFVRTSCFLTFTATSRTTLGQPYHETTRFKIEALLKTLMARADKQAAHANKADLIRKLLKERGYHRALIHQQELDIALNDLRATEAETKLVRLQKTRELNEAELQEKIRSLELRNSELTKAMANVSGFGGGRHV